MSVLWQQRQHEIASKVLLLLQECGKFILMLMLKTEMRADTSAHLKVP